MPWSTSTRRLRLPADWAKRRKAVLRRDNYTCQLQLLGCLRAASEVDHIQPNDNHSYSNLQAACERCHARKSAAEGNQAKSDRRLRRLRTRER